MKHEIKHRYTGAVLFTAEIDCAKSARISLKLGLAVKAAMEVGAYLRGADLGAADLRGAYLGDADLGAADLRGAYLGDADLRGAYLRDADLGGANLRGAYLRDADLIDADLGGADLRGAYLGDADLRGAYLRDADLGGAYLIDAGQDSRGYRFVGHMKDGALMVHAGCRYLTMDGAREHWGEDYDSNGDRLEIQAKLTLIEMTARSRGWLEDAKQAAE